MPNQTSSITTVVVALTLAACGGFLANKLHIPTLVDYLPAGVAAGPFSPAFVGDTDLARQRAEIGIVLLMSAWGRTSRPRIFSACAGSPTVVLLRAMRERNALRMPPNGHDFTPVNALRRDPGHRHRRSGVFAFDSRCWARSPRYQSGGRWMLGSVRRRTDTSA
jgi:hypothetical protein